MATATAAELELLSTQRRQAGYIANFMSNTRKAGPLTIDMCRSRLSLLDMYWKQFMERDLQLQVRKAKFDEQDYFKEDEFIRTESNYIGAQSELMAALADFEAALRPERSETNNNTSNSSGNGLAGAVDREIRATGYHSMPKLYIPKFSGKPLEWESFKEQFCLMVKNKTMDPALKMQYLLDSLEGPAAQRISVLEITGSSFDVAWQKLIRRNDNPTARMHTYMDTLIDLKMAKEESAEELMRLLDAAEVAAKVFADLKCPVEQWDCWLVHLVVKKLDPLTRKSWRISQETVAGFSTFKSLVSFLETRAQSLEDKVDICPDSPTPDSQRGSGSHRFSKRGSVSANAAATSSGRAESKGSQKCFECNGAHQIAECSRFCQMHQSSRFECCRRLRLCILCLRRGHFAAECSSTYRCAVCKGRHHTKLHINKKRAREDSKTQKDKSSNSDDSSNSGVAAHAAVVGRTRLMATAKVLLQASNGNSVHARCLVDPCAKVSFVSARIVECLSSPVKPVSISVIGVGAGSSALSRGEVSLCLRSRLDVDFCLEFRALVLNKVTGVMSREEVQFVSWEHISDLDLADPDFAKSRRVDCVLSAEVYAAIIRPGLRVGGKDEPIAQSTALGWILTGKVSSGGKSVATETQVCHARIEPSLSLILEKFWSFEEVCSTRVLSKEDQYCEDYFASTVYRDPDGRFVVRLPFSEKLHEVSFVHTRQVTVACLLRSEKRRAKDIKLNSAYSKVHGRLFEVRTYGESDWSSSLGECVLLHTSSDLFDRGWT